MAGARWILVIVMGLSATTSFSAVVVAQQVSPVEAPSARPYSPPSAQPIAAIPSPFRADRDYGRIPELLEFSSYEAFSQSLMPFGDYVIHLGYARDARLAAENLSTRQKSEIWGRYRNYLQAASAQLSAFNQPASRSWNAERAWAEYSLARADLEIALNNGDEQSIKAAQANAATTVSQLLEQRQLDYSLGMASIVDLAYAKDRYLREFRFPDESRRQLWEVTGTEIASWGGSGGQSTGQASVLQNSIIQNTLKLQQSLDTGNNELSRRQLKLVSDLSQQQFSVLSAQFQHGTVPVSELTRTAVFRNRLSMLEQNVPDLKGSFNQQQFHNDWRWLKNVADQVTDLSGRNQSDLFAIRLLETGLHE